MSYKSSDSSPSGKAWNVNALLQEGPASAFGQDYHRGNGKENGWAHQMGSYHSVVSAGSTGSLPRQNRRSDDDSMQSLQARLRTHSRSPQVRRRPTSLLLCTDARCRSCNNGSGQMTSPTSSSDSYQYGHPACIQCWQEAHIKV